MDPDAGHHYVGSCRALVVLLPISANACFQYMYVQQDMCTLALVTCLVPDPTGATQDPSGLTRHVRPSFPSVRG